MVMGGKLKFKGSKSGHSEARKREKKREIETTDGASTADSGKEDVMDKFLTDSQKRHRKKNQKTEESDMKKLVKTTYRDRIDSFNMKLSTMSEHNDIPRISAAGNG